MLDKHRLYLITGAPRSGTTALHNALIRAKIFAGVLADDMEIGRVYKKGDLYTDEFYPSMKEGVKWSQRRGGCIQEWMIKFRTERILDSLWRRFATPHGLMLKAPHYVFGIELYESILADRLKVIYLHRSPFAVALSMCEHPHVGKKVKYGIENCIDFAEFGLLRRFCDPEILNLARSLWSRLELLERALFVWSVYGQAYLLAKRHTNFLDVVIDYDGFDEGAARRLAGFLNVNNERAGSIAQYYQPKFRRKVTEADLSDEGQKLWRLLKPVDLRLRKMALTSDDRP